MLLYYFTAFSEVFTLCQKRILMSECIECWIYCVKLSLPLKSEKYSVFKKSLQVGFMLWRWGLHFINPFWRTVNNSVKETICWIWGHNYNLNLLNRPLTNHKSVLFFSSGLFSSKISWNLVCVCNSCILHTGENINALLCNITT